MIIAARPSNSINLRRSPVSTAYSRAGREGSSRRKAEEEAEGMAVPEAGEVKETAEVGEAKAAAVAGEGRVAH